MHLTKRVSGIAITTLVILAVFSALLPVQNVSADYWYGANAPYRGSFPNGGYVYTTSWQSSTQIFYFLKVRAEEWKKIDGVWTFRKAAENSGYSINTISCTAKKWESALYEYYFQNRAKFWYNVDGSYTYDFELSSPAVKL